MTPPLTASGGSAAQHGVAVGRLHLPRNRAERLTVGAARYVGSTVSYYKTILLTGKKDDAFNVAGYALMITVKYDLARWPAGFADRGQRQQPVRSRIRFQLL